MECRWVPRGPVQGLSPVQMWHVEVKMRIVKMRQRRGETDEDEIGAGLPPALSKAGLPGPRVFFGEDELGRLNVERWIQLVKG